MPGAVVLSLTRLLEALLFPPAGLLLLLAVGLLTLRRRPGFARGLLWIGVLGLYLATNPWLSGALRRSLEIYPPISVAELDRAQAIVILGGGRARAAAEYGGLDQPSVHSLIRARYGAHLARESGRPMLITGGALNGEAESESEVMARVIEDEFGVGVQWLETRSRNTFENARFSAALLREAGVGRVALVSQGLHLPRAVEVFQREGLTVFPAPTDQLAPPGDGVAWYWHWIPSPGAMAQTNLVLHEYLGRLWYRLRYG